MNAIELIENIKKYNTIDELLQSVEGKSAAEKQSKRGNVFEKIWDIIIKSGFCPILPNDIYDHYEGNINKCMLKKIDNLELYLKKLQVFSKAKGGASDITLLNKITGKWRFISSKFYLDDNKKSINDYDVGDILAIGKHNSHKYKEFDICLFVNNKQKVLDTISSSQSTNNYIKENIHNILDLKDLELCFNNFKSAIQFIPIEEYNSKFCNTKIPLHLRFHQDLITHKQMKMIDKGAKELLLGAKARSGKTYCVGGLFDKFYNKYSHLNALIITPAPSETLSQFTDDLFNKFGNFNKINIVEIKQGTDFNSMILEKDNIMIVSKQLLDDYVFEKKVEIIQQLDLDFIVFDENHFHGTTLMSKNILQSYSCLNTIKLYLTATYAKPLSEWNIPLECQFYWDIEDEQLCKKRDIQGLVEKHGEDVLLFINEENKEQMLNIYDKMPDLHIITNMMDKERYDNIKERIKDTSYGFSNSTLLSGNFPGEVDNILAFITGSNKEQDYPKKDLSIFGRIKKISIKNNSRTKLNNGDFTSQLWFLPFGINMQINKVSEHLKDRMLQNQVLNKYEIKIINSKKEYKLKDVKEEIKNWELKAKEDGKYGLILLAGNQLTLGITLPFVDIVFLFNDIVSSDKIIQMMYRCMTENINNSDNNKINSGTKKMGFVVDLNISRVLNTCLDYNVYKKDLSVEQKISYLVDNNLINIDNDLFQEKQNKTKLVEKLLQIWKSDPVNNLKILLKRIEENNIEMEQTDQKMLNKYFTTSAGDENANTKVKFDEENDDILPTGKEIIKQYDDQDNEDEDDDDDDEDDEVNEKNEDDEVINISLTKDILSYIVPLSCILTINTEERNVLEMLKYIHSSPLLLSVFNDQSFKWWKKQHIIIMIIKIIEKYIKQNSSIYNIAIQFKMSLQSLIDNPKDLLELINSCLKPKVIEKKLYGEVFTPMNFINNNMLLDLESYYKEKYNQNIYENETLKWGDTTTGMGNFPVAIYYKLMEGLKIKIPNDKDRKKHILENMLFMAENNKKNCFIVKQIFNSNNDYKLNLYEGNSLQLDIRKEFGIDKFDIVIGNPPYNEELTTKKGSAPALYNKFVEYYIEKCVFLSFVIPSRWFSGGKGLDGFRKKMLGRSDIVYIKHFEDACKIFGNSVEIKGGVNYFLKDKNHNGDCNFNGSITKLNNYDVFVDSKYYTIIDKMLQFNSINNLFIGQSYSGVNSNDKRLKDTETKTTLKCYVSQQKGFEKYIEKTEINKDRDFNKWKVITTRSSFGANSGFGNMFIGKPNEICNQSYVLFEVVNEEEANSLLTYMKCRLPNFMLSLRKASQDICESTCKWIPLPHLNKDWTDDEVYKHFNLLEEDIKLVNDTNIVGYKNIVKQPNIIVEVENKVVVVEELNPKVKKTKRIVKPKKEPIELIIEDKNYVEIIS
jgi:hypothetical protein